MEARKEDGSSSSPAVVSGFSTNAAMRPGRSGSVSMTPNWLASESGWRTAATVAETPEAMCASTIAEKSMR